MKRILIVIGIAALCIGGVILFMHYKQIQSAITPVAVPAVPTQVSLLKDGRQCYTYDHEATPDAPYTVHEFIDMTVSGTAITGTKTGTQVGPDMTNGYSGTITGTVANNMISDVFSYTVEGSKNKEEEIYRVRPDQIGIEKLRYPLIEQGDMLVPDTTKDSTVVLYARVGCTASD